MEELTEDTYLDEFTVRDKQMKLPGIKHKWTGRLIRSKISLTDLFAKRRKVINQLADKLVKESPVTISRPTAETKIKTLDAIVTIDKDIEEMKHIIEFLEKTERILSSMTFDIRNITEIMKLELQ
tara:strand:- start:9998 stop:10372 length:375 start_codon:yes stop_codon:yes gene_type:complete